MLDVQCPTFHLWLSARFVAPLQGAAMFCGCVPGRRFALSRAFLSCAFGAANGGPKTQYRKTQGNALGIMVPKQIMAPKAHDRPARGNAAGCFIIRTMGFSR